MFRPFILASKRSGNASSQSECPEHRHKSIEKNSLNHELPPLKAQQAPLRLKPRTEASANPCILTYVQFNYRLVIISNLKKEDSSLVLAKQLVKMLILQVQCWQNTNCKQGDKPLARMHKYLRFSKKCT
jgi:hypothetical protein